MGKRKKIRYRLKSSVKRFLIYSVFILLLSIYAVNGISNAIKQIEYRETYEYKLIEFGYSESDTAKMIVSIPESELDKILLEKKVNEMYPTMISQKYFLAKNYTKYIEYKTYNEKTSYEDTIAIVNTNSNADWYKEVRESNTKDNYLILVNKYNHLKEDFERNDLQIVSLTYSYGKYGDNQLAEVVYESFIQMHNDIKEELDVYLMINSSYRSYKDQESIYNYNKSVNPSKVDDYVARPGHSEHQTGLSLDITSKEHPTEDQFNQSEEYQWLKDNAHKYGFILRYPEGKEKITGYSNESWHFRYVGTDVATKIHNEGLTLDEYYAFYIDK